MEKTFGESHVDQDLHVVNKKVEQLTVAEPGVSIKFEVGSWLEWSSRLHQQGLKGSFSRLLQFRGKSSRLL